MKLLFIILLAASLSLPAKADTDKAAHLGISYVTNTIFYGFYHRAFRLKTHESLIMSTFTTLLIGATWEMMGRTEPDGQDMIHNAVGTGMSAGTILMFSF